MDKLAQTLKTQIGKTDDKLILEEIKTVLK